MESGELRLWGSSEARTDDTMGVNLKDDTMGVNLEVLWLFQGLRAVLVYAVDAELAEAAA